MLNENHGALSSSLVKIMTICRSDIVNRSHMFYTTNFGRYRHRRYRRPPIISHMIANTTTMMLLILTLVLAHVNGANGQSLNFVKSMDSHTVNENTPIGEKIYRLEAQDNYGSRAHYSLEGTSLFTVNKLTGDVSVAANIDRETIGNQVRLIVVATSVPTITPVNQLTSTAKRAETIRLPIIVYIIDRNDNPPRFKQVRLGDRNSTIIDSDRNPRMLKLNVSEDAPPGTVLIGLIEANDPDIGGEAPLTAMCGMCDPEFELMITPNERPLNNRVSFSLQTMSNLSYVPLDNVRRLGIIVTDGIFNVTMIVEITILNVQNRAPKFVGISTITVPENLPVDTPIMSIRAIDGDAISDISDQIDENVARSIYYRLKQNPKDYFSLNSLTGELSVHKRMDRESFITTNGVLSFQVEAHEIVERGSDRYDTSKLVLDPTITGRNSTTITIVLTDVNDNAPQWLNLTEITILGDAMMSEEKWSQLLSSSTLPYGGVFANTGRIYDVSISESALPGTTLPLVDLFVQDLDDDNSSMFALSLKDESGMFDIEPKRATSFTALTLKLASTGDNKTSLDYENLNKRQFILQVTAQETLTRERFNSTALIRVSVLNANDNAPEFLQTSYVANVMEDAQMGTIVISVGAIDRDAEPGKPISLTYSLVGATAHLFKVDSTTGLVSVAPCIASENPNADETQCLDYEHKSKHELDIRVSDGKLSAQVPLIIYVNDVSDNAPVMTRNVYEATIEEGSDRFDTPLRIEAHDADKVSTVHYSIVDGNFENLFTINNVTGEIQLTRPIKSINNFRDSTTVTSVVQPNDTTGVGRIVLVVRASDGQYEANSTVIIEVQDSNDSTPTFQRSVYTTEVNETIEPGKAFATVQAFDADSGPNALLSYFIQRGSFDQFSIDELSGHLSVSSVLDADRRSSYSLQVIAVDHGIVPRTGTVTISVKVLNVNNKPPEFTPIVQYVDVHEKQAIGAIYKMKARDPDTSEEDALLFNLNSIEARDKNGLVLTETNVMNIVLNTFAIDDSGNVAVANSLDFDNFAYANLTITVEDKRAAEAGDKSQVAFGYLIVSIIDNNEHAPYFVAPWTLESPRIMVQMDEERPIGSVLTQLVASDSETRVSHYKIEPPSEYFTLESPQSGIIISKRVIDYEKLINTQSPFNAIPTINFTVYAYDSGTPQLNQSALITVEIIPINDWDCVFTQTTYKASVNESDPEGTVVVRVHADDRDAGNHGRLLYHLIGDYSDNFVIDPSTGEISVSQEGAISLDKERLPKSPLLFHVVAIDSPVVPTSVSASVGLDSSNASEPVPSAESLMCSAGVIVHVRDINDNPAQFERRVYESSVYTDDASSDSSVPVLRVQVRDMDATEQHRNVTYRIINPTRLFNIEKDGTIIYHPQRHEAQQQSSSNTNGERIYSLRVEARQQHFTDECTVNIRIVSVNKYAPEFRWKDQIMTNYVSNRQRQQQQSQPIVMVAENQPAGTWVTQIECTDKDLGETKMAYSLRSFAGHQSTNSDFKLDPKTGNLTTKRMLDREQRGRYELLVACQDNGQPQSLETLAVVTVIVTDEDDNVPFFVTGNAPQAMVAKTLDRAQPKNTVEFYVDEMQGRGLVVGQVRAIDKDDINGATENNTTPISYCIVDGNEFGEFELDQQTGILYTNQSLDRERQASFEIVVGAINDGRSCAELASGFEGKVSNSASGNLISRAAEEKRRQLRVRVHINDINDSKPHFKKPMYRAGVKHRAPVSTLVAHVSAIDMDAGINATLTYTIAELLMFKRNHSSSFTNQWQSPYDDAKGVRPVHNPFRIDHRGNVYTNHLLSQYPLASLFVCTIEAREQANPWRTATTKLEIWIHETYNQVRVKFNMSPREAHTHRDTLETVLSNITGLNAIVNDIRAHYDHQQQLQLRVNSRSGRTKELEKDLTTATVSDLFVIFVEGQRLIAPQLAIDRFDSSFSLLSESDTTPTTSSAAKSDDNMILLIEKIVPATSADATMLMLASTSQRHSASGFLGEWLDVAGIFVIVTLVMAFVGLVLTCIGCCCMKSWHRDQIIKKSMDKLAQQQRLREQLAASTTLHRQAMHAYHPANVNSNHLDTILSNNVNNDNLSNLMHAGTIGSTFGVDNIDHHHDNQVISSEQNMTNQAKVQRRQQLPSTSSDQNNGRDQSQENAGNKIITNERDDDNDDDDDDDIVDELAHEGRMRI
ncbi:Cadherin-87A [Fragariocoptes setiger]|uniref:Cadherin-87A n=1 Tax=Fragariocoptes setiger TaxID=1670756 RepID=A0ABQ7S772_9ACAR|nr:Cadherin-87A [Fragariocoptes setiger]